MAIHFEKVSEDEFLAFMREFFGRRSVLRMNKLSGDARLKEVCSRLRDAARYGEISYQYYNVADGILWSYTSNRWNGELCLALRDLKFTALAKYIYWVGEHINTIGDVSHWCINHQKSLTGLGEN